MERRSSPRRRRPASASQNGNAIALALLTASVGGAQFAERVLGRMRSVKADDNMNLTADQLRAAWRCTPALADHWLPHVREALALADAESPARAAAWLAQIGHESGGGQWPREIWGPTDAQKRYEPPGKLAADLGNTQPGDGSRYRGRGLIQVTGRANYARCTLGLRALLRADTPDFEREPAALEQPRWAALSAAWFWRANGCNELADAKRQIAFTKRINGGTNGLTELIRYQAACEALNVRGTKERVGKATGQSARSICNRAKGSGF